MADKEKNVCPFCGAKIKTIGYAPHLRYFYCMSFATRESIDDPWISCTANRSADCYERQLAQKDDQIKKLKMAVMQAKRPYIEDGDGGPNDIEGGTLHGFPEDRDKEYR